MKELTLDAIAMAPINTPKKKQWVFHGKATTAITIAAGEMCRIAIDVGDNQFRLIDAETQNAPELPCA